MIARVFPRWTKATPEDGLAFYDKGKSKKALPGMFLPEFDEVHVSVAFTYDLARAEYLAKQWEHVAPVKIGGPALDDHGGEFVSGRYLKPGYTMTSRGCPGKCWFCSVWRREEREIRELPIVEGNNILDSNLLACSERHIRQVFYMLHCQKYGRPLFTGGLEAARLLDWHVDLLRELHPKEMFFAYDAADDYEPLVEAGKKLQAAGFTVASHALRCYVLCGYPGDEIDRARARCMQVINAGFMPFAMLYRDREGKRDPWWSAFNRYWARPATVNLEMREVHLG